MNRSGEHSLVYRELSRHARPTRVITAFEDAGSGWEHSALRMFENYSLTWGGARALLVPVDEEGGAHEALWPLIEIFDADIWAVYNRTIRDFRLADPDGFESWLQARIADRVETQGCTPDEARAVLTADYTLDELDGGCELSDSLFAEIMCRTAPALSDDLLHISCFTADVTPAYPLMDVSELRPLPNQVAVMDTSSLPLALRVLIAMRCGGVASRQQRRLEDAGIATENVAVGPEELEELLALCWRGMYDPPGLVLATDALATPRLATTTADAIPGKHVYAVPSGLSLLGCSVLQRLGPWRSGTPLTLVLGSTADDFAYALALDRCGLPAWWVPDPASLGDDSIAPRMLNTLARSITMERLPLEKTGQGNGVEVCSLSMPSEEVRSFCTELPDAGSGIWGLEVRETARAKTPERRIELVAFTHHANEPLDEPFRHETMLRPVPAAPPTALTSNSPLRFSWWVDVEDHERQIPNRTALGDLLLAEPKPTDPLVRSGRDGISYHSLRGGVLRAGEPLGQLLARPRLRFPEASAVFRHLFEHAGFKIDESNTGRYRRLTTDLWGGFDELHQDLANDATRTLLKAWTSTKPSGVAPGFWDRRRRYLSLDDASRASRIAADDLRTVLDGYLSRGILRRGLVLKCSHCLNATWYPLDDISQSFTCDRCRTETAITEPSWSADHRKGDPAAEPTFYYALAEVAYQALRLNADVPIRALGAIRTRPTENIQQTTDSIVSMADQRFELDLLALVDGHIIIGEAKEGGSLKSKAGNEVPWLNALADIAEAITADGVLFATATTWKPKTLERINEVFSSRRIETRIVELGPEAGSGIGGTSHRNGG